MTDEKVIDNSEEKAKAIQDDWDDEEVGDQ